MYLSGFFRIFSDKIMLFFIFNVCVFSTTKTRSLKNFDIRSDSAVCYENIFELHFLRNVLVISDHLNLKTNKLVIAFTNDFKDINKLNFIDNIDCILNHKYKFFVKEGVAIFFNNIFSFNGNNAHFLIKTFSKKSDMILRFNYADLYFCADSSSIKKIIFKNNVKCVISETLFVGDKAEFNADSNIIIISGNVYILDRDNNYVISEKVEININESTYKLFHVKDGYKKI